MTELEAALALSTVRGVGPRRQRELVTRHKSHQAALASVCQAPDARARLLLAGREIIARAERSGQRILVDSDPEYPAGILHLSDAPPVLFSLGSLAALAAPLIAIVGTRRPSSYGDRMARQLSTVLARAGACVVSGMALGIDGTAHRAALESGGRTVAVLGTGADYAYPPSHRQLHVEIARRGLVMSEFPPGEKAGPGSFPRRNRIIAALAQAVIVVEAPLKSGALNTAEHALDLGRTVAVVPGPIDMPQCAGSNALMRDGASVITSAADALALVGLDVVHAAPRSAPAAPDQRQVWDALAGGPLDTDTLASRVALPAHRCLAALSALELSGAVECELTGLVRRR